nr:hypothetical protein [uncultured Carboxylicivirga sp.]
MAKELLALKNAYNITDFCPYKYAAYIFIFPETIINGLLFEGKVSGRDCFCIEKG